MVTQNYGALVGPHGPLAGALSRFTARPQQQAMAQAVGETLETAGTLLVEAGTGTGKTFGYLAPVMAWGGKVIVSTGTRALQDQLYHRDLPMLREALGVPGKTALLKGRGNYLCLHRLALSRSTVSQGSADAQLLAQLTRWAEISKSGDLAEAGFMSQDASLWPQVTSSVDNCLGGDCPCYERCFLVRARRAAQSADLLIVNHHLLFADLALRREGFGELLPSADAYIIDEAHQLPETASRFLGRSLTAGQLKGLARDAVAEERRECADMPELAEAAARLEAAVDTLRRALGAPEQRKPWRQWAGESDPAAAVRALAGALGEFASQLAVGAERSQGLAQCASRAAMYKERLAVFTTDDGGIDGHVAWAQTHRHSFALHLTPIDVAPAFASFMAQRPAAWVFTSATLAVGEDFSHFAAELGLQDYRTLRLDSPFDFPTQGLLYLPQGLPAPSDPGYTDAVIDVSLPLIEASGGRCFFLFTSHRAMNHAAIRLGRRIRQPLLVQGQAAHGVLLQRFTDSGQAVLLGTASFWEGVDVPGSALELVIIDRLPFASPADPILAARLQAAQAAGEQPFLTRQLPQAVISLKQGVGRLIRDEADHGVMVLCDPRLRQRGYGRVFLSSLPPMPVTHDLEAVQDFIARRRLREGRR